LNFYPVEPEPSACPVAPADGTRGSSTKASIFTPLITALRSAIGGFNRGLNSSIPVFILSQHLLLPSIISFLFSQITPKRLDLSTAISGHLINMIKLIFADIPAIQCPVKLRLNLTTRPQRVSKELDELFPEHIIKTLSNIVHHRSRSSPNLIS
jgi:hypothetical protein